ncbi:hypothetical protein [Tritonibacter sp. SIMBA_163]|uniref:hypothetical protein n=1 Tax=Tritonibacter sp. SIMBA_163 TaxID=3080868 RepID=UPI0039807332
MFSLTGWRRITVPVLIGARDTIWIKLLKSRIFPTVLAVLCLGTGASAAQLECKLTKVWFAHPYLPTSLVLEADEHFLNVKLRDVQIKNVATNDTVAKVVYRGQNRLRMEWPTADYKRTGPAVFPNRNTFRNEPELFRATLSLDLRNFEFKVEMEDKRLAAQYGQAIGTCKKVR